MRRFILPVAELLASQERLCSMTLIGSYLLNSHPAGMGN